MATPSLLMIPSAFKSGVLASVLPSDGTGDFTVSRPSVATRVNSEGLIETMAANVPRLDYSDGGCPVLLTEPQSTNELLWSEDFSQASWSKDANVGVLSQDTISPTGILDGTTLKDSNIGGTGVVASSIGVTVETLTNYTLSLFAKKDQLDWVYLNLANFTSVSNLPVYFNLANGTLGSAVAGVTTKIEDYGSGWYRCSATFTSDSVDTSGTLVFGLGIGDALRTIPLDGTSSIKVFGAMFEKQSYATSYIKTEGTTITRVADVVSVTVPSGVTEIIETQGGVEQAPITNIPTIYTVPNNTLGSEEIVNGTFDTDLTNFVPLNADNTFVSSQLLAEYNTANPNWGIRYNSPTTITPSVFEFSIDILNNTSGVLISLSIANLLGTYTKYYIQDGVGSSFIAEWDGRSIFIEARGSTVGAFYIDNVSAKEVVGVGSKMNSIIMNS